jgi:small subunit ribosomal protein S13
MARISGIDLPKNKRGEIGLTYIFGIGRSPLRKFLAIAMCHGTRKLANGTTKS